MCLGIQKKKKSENICLAEYLLARITEKVQENYFLPTSNQESRSHLNPKEIYTLHPYAIPSVLQGCDDTVYIVI